MTLPNDPLSGVVITAREIYDGIVRLTGRVDVLITQHSDMAGDLKDHETRLRVLEKARWPLPSLAALIAVVSLALTIIPKL